MKLPDETAIAHVHLRVRSAAKAESFYEGLLGFQKMLHNESTYGYSAGSGVPVQIILSESPDAVQRPHGTTGLFHVAIRYPSRMELAKILVRLAQQGYPLHGASDHAVSEAIYLADPEGNGVELYVDRPKEQWRRLNGEIHMTTQPLDLDALMGEAKGTVWTGMDARTDIGHIHLNVGSLASAESFYHNELGFDVTTRSYPGALFLSAGGYHHHIGANIWAGRNAPKPPANAAGLISFGIAIPANDWDRVAAQFSERPMQHDFLQKEILTLHDADGIAVELLPVEKTE